MLAMFYTMFWGWLLQGFPKGFKNAKITVLEHLELKTFFTAQPW